ncbi:MAG TPA: hypothetical protein VE153_39135 [Myxococcus sp.]|nr:hypothetical protein [Myxococcus sp.]
MTSEEVHRDRQHGRPTRVALGLAWLALLLAAGACQDTATAAGTALYVTADFDPALRLTQLKVSGAVEGGEPVGPSVLPESPGRELASGETFRVLLPDAPQGALVALELRGLREGQAAARGTAEARVRQGYEVDVVVRMEAWSETPGPGTPDGGEPDSGTPDSGTFCMDCADGCCRNGFCVRRTFLTCGVGGVDCVACDGARADTCSALGICACGGGPACTGINVDRCEGGQCKCGGSSPCGAGQECVNGQCRCTPGSCPNGCCVGDTCEPGNEQSKCGTGGEACQQCRKECTPQRVCK